MADTQEINEHSSENHGPFVIAELFQCDGTAQRRGIGYPTVETALQALKSSGANKISVTPDDWTIVSEGARGPLWSFTPNKHPAHPAAVKRTPAERNGSIVIEMSALCQASKSVCDGLIEEFKLLNERISKDVKAKTAPALAVTDSPIKIEELDNDSFRLVLKSKLSGTPAEGQLELMPKVNELCGARSATLGKFQYDLTEPLDASNGAGKTLILRQDILCQAADSSTAGAAGRSSPQKIASSALQDRRAESETLAYFSLLDGAKYKEAYAKQSLAQREIESFDRWRERVSKFNSFAGAVISKKIKKIT